MSTASIACGVLGVGGNKGAVAVSFSLHRRRIAFVCSHFAAHQVCHNLSAGCHAMGVLGCLVPLRSGVHSRAHVRPHVRSAVLACRIFGYHGLSYRRQLMLVAAASAAAAGMPPPADPVYRDGCTTDMVTWLAY